MKTRTEEDSLGKLEIPQNALYGIQSFRASQNFQISGRKNYWELISAYALLKKAIAHSNTELWKLDSDIANEIAHVCDEIHNWKLQEEFIVDLYQAWAGTSTNMNLNEVIANRILEKKGEKKWSYHIISPNDIVNMSQSTNDTYPSAMRIALVQMSPSLISALQTLKWTFEKKSKQYYETITSARTHLQDAVPITLWQEFQSYGDTISGLTHEYISSVEELKMLWIGGSAAGTGLNTHTNYHEIVISKLSQLSWITFHTSNNLVESMQSQRQIWAYMNQLANIATELTRICNDLRLLSSWPNTGIWEIELPSVQAGSSIMPGKVNPSILECVNMVCFDVLWSRHSIEQCLLGWQVNLNVFMPLMAHKSIESTKVLTNAIRMMSEKCIDWIKANKNICREYAYESNGIFTALNPILWYHRLAKIVQKRAETGVDIQTILEQETELSPDEIKSILDPLVLSNAQDEVL